MGNEVEGDREGEQFGGIESAGGGAEEGDGGATFVPDSGEVEDGTEEGGSGEVVETDCVCVAFEGR